jgi:hypothetical protein
MATLQRRPVPDEGGSNNDGSSNGGSANNFGNNSGNSGGGQASAGTKELPKTGGVALTAASYSEADP